MNNPRTFARGVVWIGGARLLTQALSWATTLVVVRFLSAADYGVMGMASAFLAIAAILSEFGIGTAIIAAADLPDDRLRQLHGVALLTGLAGCAVCLACAWPLGLFFREPRLPLVVSVMSVTFIIDALRTVPVALLQRRLDYRGTAFVESCRSLTSTVVVLAAAFAGLGYWSLVLGAVSASFVASSLATFAMPVRVRQPEWAQVSGPMRVAGNLLVDRLAWQAYSYGDFAVVGRIFGSALLGQYTLAWNLASLPGQKLTNLLTAVSSSFLPSLREDLGEMRRYFLVLVESIALLTMPLLLGLAFVAPDAISVAFTDQWAAAILPLRLLALYSCIQCVSVPLSQVLVATGRSHIARTNSLVTLCVLIPGFVLGAQLGGIVGVAAAWLVLFPVVVLRPYHHVRRVLGFDHRDLAAALFPALAITGGMLASLALVHLALSSANPWQRLVTEVVTGALAALLVLRVAFWAKVLAARDLLRPARASVTP